MVSAKRSPPYCCQLSQTASDGREALHRTPVSVMRIFDITCEGQIRSELCGSQSPNAAEGAFNEYSVAEAGILGAAHVQ